MGAMGSDERRVSRGLPGQGIAQQRGEYHHLWTGNAITEDGDDDFSRLIRLQHRQIAWQWRQGLYPHLSGQRQAVSGMVPLTIAGRTAAQAHSNAPGRAARCRCSDDT
jgi:hypothetical protein